MIATRSMAVFALLVYHSSCGPCSEAEAEQSFSTFLQQDGFKGSRCPLRRHLDIYARLACAGSSRRNQTGLVIGGNTGTDCVGFARLLSGDPRKSFETWTRDVTKHTRRKFPKSICDSTSLREYPLGPPRDEARVLCVEPLPSNVETLLKASMSPPWNGSLGIYQAAVSDAVAPNQSVTIIVHSLRSEHFGVETAHIDLQKRGPGLIRYPNKKKVLLGVQVTSTTVDEIIAQNMNGAPPYLLSVDTEGFDALVLRGAARTLASGQVGYVEFEYHRLQPWFRMRLRDTIAELDAFGYDCYWAQPRLVRITGCFPWHKFEAMTQTHMWSNVVCARRKDPCWAKALELACEAPS
mmetsp:Transcript_43834/g.99082  ORF Transcript_43834/g.99082 Transcript_43834/m.99082 type:complete len:351 (-) Transcript_43834:199-1251(-)